MHYFSRVRRLVFSFTCSLLLVEFLPTQALSPASIQPQKHALAQAPADAPDFLVFGGGSAPCNNEIALEKNILYFQRTLRQLGHNPASASIFFANGNNNQTTIRYLDEQGLEQYKAPKIPHLDGAASFTNLQNWMEQSATQETNPSIFFYFTGHGGFNPEDPDNNRLSLWHRQSLSVQELASMLDTLPPQTSFVAMMAQCYSGSFANFIYEAGDPNNPIALQSRCGFFATVRELPSVGCTPEVNEADYRDYSSSFFAGLSGVDRTGKAVPSADYNQDGKVSYAEAHAFAKVDDKSLDRPVSTSEVWLETFASQPEIKEVFGRPLVQLLKMARPERRYVVESWVKTFEFNLEKSFIENVGQLRETEEFDTLQNTYLTRLSRELIYIAMEEKIRRFQNQETIAILERLLECEGGSWEAQ
ncbi:MAG: Caspase domain-containing protein [Coleofasciculus sp. B1-GNL1-01]|uniref:Caspase domain-containing protein n=1 Tax=Coleofasciculus sp. B1-GNL1-01 TaxID=3068484 RepID=UPI0033001D2B